MKQISIYTLQKTHFLLDNDADMRHFSAIVFYPNISEFIYKLLIHFFSFLVLFIIGLAFPLVTLASLGLRANQQYEPHLLG